MLCTWPAGSVAIPTAVDVKSSEIALAVSIISSALLMTAEGIGNSVHRQAFRDPVMKT